MRIKVAAGARRFTAATFKPEDPMSLQHARQRLLTTREELEARLVRTHKHMHRAEAPSPNFHEQVVETANDVVVQALDADGSLHA